MIHRLRRPAIPPGLRLYVLGGIEGDPARLEAWLGRIEADLAGRARMSTRLIVAGEIPGVRGNSAEAMLRAMRITKPFDSVAIFRGNAERALLAALDGDKQAAALLPEAMLAGWHVAATDPQERVARLQEAVPATMHHWLARRPAKGRIGDYSIANGQVFANDRPLRRKGDGPIGLEGRRRWAL